MGLVPPIGGGVTVPAGEIWLLADWNGDGSFQRIGGVRQVEWWRGFSRPYAACCSEGWLRARLANQDGVLNTGEPQISSPGWGFPMVGSGVCLVANVGGANKTIWAGVVRRLRSLDGVLGARELLLEGVDGLGMVGRLRPRLGFGSVVSVHDAMVYLGSYRWGADPDDIGDVIANWGTYWTRDEDTQRAITEVAENFGGRAFYAANGEFEFRSREHEQHCERAWALDLDTAAGGVRSLEGEADLADVVSRARVTVFPPPVLGAPGVLWKAQNVLRIAPGGTRTIYAPYVDQVTGERIGAASLQAITAYTDYVVSEFRDGGGVDYTTSARFSVAVFDGDGTRARIELGNTASGALYLQKLQVRGVGVYRRDPVAVERVDSQAVEYFGEQEWAGELRMVGSEHYAGAYAEYLISRRARVRRAARRVVCERQVGGTDVLGLDLLDLVKVTDSASGQSGVRHQVSAMGGLVRPGVVECRLELELGVRQTYAVLDRVGLAELDSAARLGF